MTFCDLMRQIAGAQNFLKSPLEIRFAENYLRRRRVPIGPGDGPRLGYADVRQSLQMEDMNMTNAFDFAPYRRSTVGFDRLFDMLEGSVSGPSQDTYPPFDLVSLDKNHFRINLALAGFGQEEIDITAQQNQLVVSGKRRDDDKVNYIHRGIATRSFERRFSLADHIKVTDAVFKDGLLSIELEREIPEAMKPRKINIGGSEQAQRIDAVEPNQEENKNSSQRRVTKNLEDA
jgi:molecular chaperone IbpA